MVGKQRTRVPHGAEPGESEKVSRELEQKKQWKWKVKRRGDGTEEGGFGDE